MLTDQDEMSNLNRGPTIDASYQVLLHLAKWFQKSTNQKQEFPMVAMFLANWDDLNYFYRRPSIDASY